MSFAEQEAAATREYQKSRGIPDWDDTELANRHKNLQGLLSHIHTLAKQAEQQNQLDQERIQVLTAELTEVNRQLEDTLHKIEEYKTRLDYKNDVIEAWIRERDFIADERQTLKGRIDNALNLMGNGDDLRGGRGRVLLSDLYAVLTGK